MDRSIENIWRSVLLVLLGACLFVTYQEWRTVPEDLGGEVAAGTGPESATESASTTGAPAIEPSTEAQRATVPATRDRAVLRVSDAVVQAPVETPAETAEPEVPITMPTPIEAPAQEMELPELTPFLPQGNSPFFQPNLPAPAGVNVAPLAPPFILPETLPKVAGRVSLRIEDQEIRKALELLGTQANVNIVVSPTVSGTISVNLEDVSFGQALEVLLKLGRLGAKYEGDVIYVYTAEELTAIEAGANLPVIRVYHLNYIRAIDLAMMIRPFLSPPPIGSFSMTPMSGQGLGSSSAAGLSSGGAGGMAGGGMGGGGGAASAAGAGTGAGGGGMNSGTFVSAGGSVGGASSGGNSLSTSDMLIVRDLPEKLQAIDDIVARLDVQPLQVLIEAVILQVDLTDNQELGVNFSVIDNLERLALVTGSAAAINAAAGFTPASVLSTAAPSGTAAAVRAGTLAAGYALSPDAGVRFGFISDNVSGFVKALETLTKVNVLASPRILVLNKQLAEIQLGRRLGYRNTVTNLTSSLQTVQFLSVGTLLSLRPYVSSDGMIRLEIHPEKSSGVIDPTTGVPQTNTSELTTNILVADGTTIVLGGLMDNSDQVVENGVLGLSRLPIIGPLFRNRATTTTKTELIVLLTPRILNRHGLPGPMPGVAPRGPSGIPNSGPMPGPSLRPTPGPLSPAASVGPVPVPAAPGPPVVSPPPLPESWPVPAPLGPDAGPLSRTPAQDANLQPTVFREPVPIAVSRLRPDPGPLPSRPAAPAVAVPEVSHGYRPGDLTRAAIERLARLRPGSNPSPGPGPVPEPLTRTSVTLTEPAQRFTGTHVVRRGEDLGRIALRYYGTPDLRGALWAANRDRVASPDALTPGTTLVIPRRESLDRVILENFRPTPSPDAPEPAHDTPRHGLLRFFRHRD